MTRVALLRGADTIYESVQLSDVVWSDAVRLGEQLHTTEKNDDKTTCALCCPSYMINLKNLTWAPSSPRPLAAAEMCREGFINRKQMPESERRETRWKTARTDGQTEEGERHECQFSGSRPPSAEGWSSRQSAGSEFKPLIAPLKQHGLQVVRSRLTSVRPLILADTNVSAFKLRQKKKTKNFPLLLFGFVLYTPVKTFGRKHSQE